MQSAKLVGCNLKRLRAEYGISQHDLARKAKISRGTIANLETGYGRAVTVDTLLALADALEADPGDLLAKKARTKKSLAPRSTAE